MKQTQSKLQQNRLRHNPKWRTSIFNLWRKVFVYVLIYSLSTNFHVTFASQDSNELASDLLDGIGKAADFFLDSYEDINVDGLFGLQVGQGQLTELSRWLNKTELKWKKPVQKIMQQMEEVLDLTLENNMALDNSYTQKFLNILKHPFYFQRQVQQIDLQSLSTEQNISLGLSYDEELGDDCFARLLGSYVENGRTLPNCTVTDQCLSYMTTPNTTGYFLTHQLIYFIFIQKIGCDTNGLLRKYSERPTVRDIQRDLCRRIYQEAKAIAKNGKVSTIYQDLFAEQTFLCAPLGYIDFLRKDWMKMILSWQDPSGCFAFNPPSKRNQSKRSSSTMRKLLRDKTMKGGCLSHKTGLGYADLTIYLNFLIQDSEWDNPKKK